MHLSHSFHLLVDIVGVESRRGVVELIALLRVNCQWLGNLWNGTDVLQSVDSDEVSWLSLLPSLASHRASGPGA